MTIFGSDGDSHENQSRGTANTEDNRRLRPPDLQEWVARYGGYDKINWEAWDAAVKLWRAAYQQELQREKLGP